jgi:nucleotide-binding universal stress UspA family protein
VSKPNGTNLVVGIDGSEPSRAALRWAVHHAELTGGRVHAVAVWRQPSVVAAPDAPAALLPVTSDADLEAQARTWVDEALAEVPASADLVVSRVEEGDPDSVLLELASDAELLILGNKARGAIAGAIAGSVALHCLHHARRPVVLVPADDLPRP